MTHYIDQLTKDEENLLKSQLGFSSFRDGFRKGEKIYYAGGYKIYYSYNHDYMSSADYVDDYLAVSDYNVKCVGDRQTNLQTLFAFMYDKFGEEWANKAVKYLSGKKAKRSVEFVQGLSKTNPIKDDPSLTL